MIPVPHPIDIITFATDKKWLGKDLPPAKTSILKAVYGLDMNREERGIFLQMTEGRAPNPRGYQSVVLVCGQRGGKSIVGSLIGTYEAVRWNESIKGLLAPGQTAKGIVIAQDERGANESRNYIEGDLCLLHERYGGVLADVSGQERAITGSGIRMAGPIEIMIFPAKKAAVRSATGLFVIADEIAWWETAEGAYNQDIEIMRGARKRLITLAPLKPRLVMLSSPNEEHGELWTQYKKRATSKALVIHAPTWTLYPGISQEELDKEQEEDPEGFLRDFGAQFQKVGGESNVFFDPQTVEACIQRGVKQIPPRPGVEYLGWLDAGFKRDRFFLGIAHTESYGEIMKPDGKVIRPSGLTVTLDQTRWWTPKFRKGHRPTPLDPVDVVTDCAAELKHYGLERVFGDQFADIPLKAEFDRHGILFVEAPASNPEKVDAFKNLRGALRAKQVSLLDDGVTEKDLKGLIKKETGGTMTIAAPRRSGCYDDAANVVARLVRRLLPLATGVNLSEVNARAIQRQGPRVDWRTPSDAPGMDGRIMEAVY